MLTLRQVLFMQATTGTCPSEIREVIRGWGQYKDTLETLAQSERDKIAALADIVVGSFTAVGCQPLGQIIVIGHADKDAKGAAFEKKVSDERAISVAAGLGKAIKDRWIARHLGAFHPGAIAFLPVPHGVGATQPDAANVPVARDRSLNRRVVIEIKPRGAPVPRPFNWEDAARRGLELARKNPGSVMDKGQQSRLSCAMNKVLNTDKKDAYMLWEDFKDIDGTRPPPHPEQWVGSLVHHLRTDLGVRAVYGWEVRDDDFIKAMQAWDENITRTLRNINRVITATAPAGGASAVILKVWRVIFDFIDGLIANDDQVMSCFFQYWKGLPWPGQTPIPGL